MPEYIQAGTQTEWAGLMQRETIRPEILLSPPHNLTTPPDDMITEKAQFVHGFPSIASPPHVLQPTPSCTSLLERRQNRAGLNSRIPLPPANIASHELNDEVPRSPPTTHALLSPLPEANKRHAGHTPLIPQALSPEMEVLKAPLAQAHAPVAEDGVATPDVDEGLTGALTLPTDPVDGADDRHIGLDKLDQVLSKISRQQAELRGEFPDEPKPSSPTVKVVEMSTEDGLPLSRKGSADSHRSGVIEEVDGVILKSPPSNFGAPLGSLG